MGIIVTGLAPRCGTSAMMRLLLDNGWSPSPVSEKFPEYVAPEMNPDGFWDVTKEWGENPTSVSLKKSECVKLWYQHFPYVDPKSVDLIIAMYREDEDQQTASIYKCAAAEKVEGWSDDLIDRARRLTPFLAKASFPSVPMLSVETEELRSNPEIIISKVKEAALCQ